MIGQLNSLSIPSPFAPRGGGDAVPTAEGLPVFTGGNCRRLAAEMPVPTGRGKRGQGHHMVPLPPLDSPKPSFAPRLPSVAQRNGGYGGSVPCVGQILGRCYALNLLCVNRRA